MKKAFDLTEVRVLLRRMVASGYLTVEDLDTPSSGWRDNAKRFALHYPKYQQPEYVNPLRTPDESPSVQPIDPRDFTPAHSGPDFSPRDSSLSLPGTLDSSLDHHRGERQDPSPDGSDHGQQERMGTEGQHSPPVPGDVPLDW